MNPFKYVVLEPNVFRITNNFGPGQLDFIYDPRTYAFIHEGIKCKYQDYYYYIANCIKLQFKNNITYVGVSERQTECVRDKIAKKIMFGGRHILKVIFDNEIAPQIDPQILSYHKYFFQYNQRMMDLAEINSLKLMQPRKFLLGSQSIYPFIMDVDLRIDPTPEQLLALRNINGNIYKDIITDVMTKPITIPINSKYHFIAQYHINYHNQNSNVWKLTKEEFPLYMREAIKLKFMHQYGKRIDSSANIKRFCEIFDDKIGNI